MFKNSSIIVFVYYIAVTAYYEKCESFSEKYKEKKWQKY